MSTRYVDLVRDFAGQESFVVDSEAVLQALFNDGTLDLGGGGGSLTSTTKLCILIVGFQMLHCVYLAERFLLNLISRRCVFAVIFFEGISVHFCD